MGEVLFAGSGSFSLTGRSSKPSNWDGVEETLLLRFHRVKGLSGISIRKIISGPIAHHFLAVSSEGTCYSWGRNEDGQLGTGDFMNRYNPVKLSLDGEVVAGGSCSASHTIVHTQSGQLYVWGSNKSCELGIGKSCGDSSNVPRKNTNLSDVSCASTGKGFSIFVCKGGEVYSAGCGEFGVLGNGTEGKTLERAGKFTFSLNKTPQRVLDLDDEKIIAVASGQSHTVAMNSEGKLWSWGFNGYGQLGQGDNKNRLSPTPIEFFHNETKPKPPNIPAFMWRSPPLMRAQRDLEGMPHGAGITCGMSCTYVIANQSYLYMFGITKKTNEACLSPELYDGLNGWPLKGISVGPTSSIAAPDGESKLITWGPSPTYGELGYGAKGAGPNKSRSSTVTKLVDDLTGCEIQQVVMAAGYSLVIASAEGKSGKILEDVPLLEPAKAKVSTKVSTKRKQSGKEKENGSKKKKKKKK